MSGSRSNFWLPSRGTLLAIAGYVLAGILLGGYFWDSYELFNVNVGAIFAIATVGWVLAFGLAGQLSLGHALFLGLAGYISAILSIRTGLPLLLTAAIAVAATTALAAIVAFPLLRVRGLFLAIATLGLAMIAENVAIGWQEMTGGTSGMGGVPGWDIAGFSSTDPRNSFILLWGILGLTWLTTRLIWRSPFGKAATTAAEDENAAASLGFSIRTLRALTFTVSAAFAGLAGVLMAHYQNFMGPNDIGVSRSIDIVVYGVVGGIVAPIGGVVGTELIELITSQLQGFDRFRVVTFGVIVVLVMMFFDDGLVGQFLTVMRRFQRRMGDRLPTLLRQSLPPFDPSATAGEERRRSTRAAATADNDEVVVRCEGVTRNYGGVIAANQIDLEVRRGEVYAIIGPNGAGKTTLLNTLSRFIPVHAGQITVLGQDALELGPHQLARLGVRRTFQTPHVVQRLTVLDNIAIGYFGTGPLTLRDATILRPRGRRIEYEARSVAYEWAVHFGLENDLLRYPNELPPGHQRLMELARAMAGDPKLLLLDEPTAGLNSEELDAFKEQLESAIAGGPTVIVIDHQMEFVRNVADRVLVLDRGQVLAEGDPTEVIERDVVIEAYLGRRPTGKPRTASLDTKGVGADGAA